ncbi:Fic/DOC family N-terminal domain-containing protein [Parasegetibacter sp. NRK P23]|uniref:Fic/DOC family N-terminal domain-containing protein n=1 Tax=Parasegetibacter sp. NRK P23 TaxID=2942999 RepID=UPI0020446D27|nr:Fic/DOC family N-terminal domain-containing protein [Parasegetibacter sp. NRK P23]MCM5527762.1 hypothetical protein [Parasegetibacter sp. NRK P23]
MAISMIPTLPFTYDIESKVVLKKLSLAHKALAALNGGAETIPNEVIILNTLSLQEAKDSSAIENIITTHDELYSSDTIAQRASKNLTRSENVLTKLINVNMFSALSDEIKILLT